MLYIFWAVTELRLRTTWDLKILRPLKCHGAKFFARDVSFPYVTISMYTRILFSFINILYCAFGMEVWGFQILCRLLLLTADVICSCVSTDPHSQIHILSLAMSLWLRVIGDDVRFYCCKLRYVCTRESQKFRSYVALNICSAQRPDKEERRPAPRVQG